MAVPTFNGERGTYSSAILVASTSYQITLTSDMVGNFLLVACGGNAVISSVTDSKGNTYNALGNSIGSGGLRDYSYGGAIGRKLMAGDTVTITTGVASGANAVVVLLDYSGAHLTALLAADKQIAATGSSTSPASGNTGATTVEDEVVIGVTVWAGPDSDYSATGAGYTQRGTIKTNASYSVAVEDKTISATGVQASSATLANSRAWIQRCICIRGQKRWYVDFSKADNTGAGTSWATAKKDISGVTPLPGDLVTIAKTDPASLSGTMTFTDGSTSVATSVDLTGTLAAKDMIGPYTGSDPLADGWWEVSSLTSSTITLVSLYSGTTRTSVTGYRLNGNDVGSPALAGTATQNNGQDGLLASPISFTGGYNTGNDTREGMTVYRVTGASKTGVQTFSGGYQHVSYIGNARFATGISLTGTGGTADHIFGCFNTNGLAGNGVAGWFSNFFVCGGLCYPTGQSSVRYRFTNGRVEGNGVNVGGDYSVFDNVTVRRCTNLNGGFTVAANFVTVQNCTATNSTRGFIASAFPFYVSGCTFSSNTTADIAHAVLSSIDTGEWGYSANNLCSSTTPYTMSSGGYHGVDRDQQTAKAWQMRSGTFGRLVSNTADARTNTCVEMIPNSAINSFWDDGEQRGTEGANFMEWRTPIFVPSSGTLTVTFYVKASSTWAGRLRTFGLQRCGIWASGSPIHPVLVAGGSYAQSTLTFSCTEAGFVEFVARVDGTAGSVYVSDLTWSVA